ncbi:unnamed protein product, partial [Protopolystoma xenopodis]
MLLFKVNSAMAAKKNLADILPPKWNKLASKRTQRQITGQQTEIEQRIPSQTDRLNGLHAFSRANKPFVPLLVRQPNLTRSRTQTNGMRTNFLKSAVTDASDPVTPDPGRLQNFKRSSSFLHTRQKTMPEPSGETVLAYRKSAQKPLGLKQGSLIQERQLKQKREWPKRGLKAKSEQSRFE